MIDILKPLIKQFMPFAQKEMGFNRPPKLFLRQDEQNAADPLGKTGFYDPQKESITIFTAGRHPKDVMRSLAHELMHHAQNCKGDFDNVENMGEQGYAQSNTHLRTMEIQAYQASIVFRDWEDSIKGTIYNESLQKGANENMSTKNWKNKELKTLLTEKWGFKMNLSALSEGRVTETDTDEDDPEETEEESEEDLPPWLKKKKEEVQEEGFDKPKPATGAGPTNKGGKTDRSDVANKADPKLGRSPNRGQKKSASGAQTPPQAGRMDRTDVANKASGRWIKEGDEMRPFEPHEEALFEEASTTCNQRHQIQGDKAVRACIEEEMTRLVNENQDLYEMCPGPEEGEGMELEIPMGVEMGAPEEEGGDVADLAAQAMEAIHKLAVAAGADLDTTVKTDEDTPDLEEISKRKDDPRNRRAKEWPDRMRESKKTKGTLTENRKRKITIKVAKSSKR